MDTNDSDLINANTEAAAAATIKSDNTPEPPTPSDDKSTTPSASSSRPSTPVKTSTKKKAPKNDYPRAVSVMNNLSYQSSLPFRFYGLDLVDTVRTNYPFIYRINDGVSNNTVLQHVCEERGWHEFKDPLRMGMRERELYNNVGWNLWWSYNFYQGSPFRTLKCWQFTNHNPRAFQFCNKSYLTSFLRKMLQDFGAPFDFSPKSFIMPEDYIRFVTEHTRRQEQNCSESNNVIITKIPRSANSNLSSAPSNNNNQKTPGKTSRPTTPRSSKQDTITTRTPVWITKPVGRSQGKGIYLTTDVGIIAQEHHSVVQEYISRPLLIGGYKWDIRIYVCVASTDPLVIYMYREGLCRFATEKFDLNKLTSNYSHLTNSSLNKLGPDYPKQKEVIGAGCKWSLKQLRKYFKQCGISDWYLWQKIMSMVLLTVVGEGLRSGYSYPAHKNCFDFFGFDILVDENLRPWLLEVNYSPGLGGDCEVDAIVKKPMLHELFDLLGFPNSSEGPDSQREIIPKSNKLVSKMNKPYFRPESPKTPNSICLSNKNSKTPKIDCSCKGRLKEASAIYSQDFVAKLLESYSKDPTFRMSKSMRTMLNKKKDDRKNKLKKKITGSDDISTDDAESEHGSGHYSARSPTIQDNLSTEEHFYQKFNPAVTKWLEDDRGGPYIYLRRQDWSNPMKSNGNWVLVYPCKGYPYRSPYRSSLSDLRGIVKTVENYLQVAEIVFRNFPGKSDTFYRSKMKAMCRWDIDLWIPPEELPEPDANVVPFLR